MKKLIYIIPVITTLLVINACNFLDVSEAFEDTIPYDSVFATKRNIERYLWATAAELPDEGRILMDPYTPGPMATDEGFTTFNLGQFGGMDFVLGGVTADNYRFDTWSRMYKIIRKTNIILNRMDEARDMTTFDRAEILGYTRFLRAYAYYNILIDYGPVILLGDEVLENNETPEYYATHRATYDESVDYICDELEEAARYMPGSVLLSYFGRPSRWAAYGLIARLRLHQASPLFNGGNVARTTFGDWKRSIDGVSYISMDYDETKWALAAAACKRIIENGDFELHVVGKEDDTPVLPANVSDADFPYGAGNIDPFRSYSDMFTGESVPQTNKEYVWGKMSNAVVETTKHSFNVDELGGWNGMCITQKVVDAFRMVDGRTINNSSFEYPYSEDGMDNSGMKIFSGYTLNNNISNMYANREMRFYASVGFSRRFWTCSSTSDAAYKNKTIEYHYDGNSGRYKAGQNNSENYPSTGYVITKFIHENDAWKGDGSTRISKGFGIIRYAEILLSYVEAMNNLTESHTITLPDGDTYTVSRDESEMAFHFNQVRFRAGLPGLEPQELSSVTEMQSLLERERMIEFLFENRRYYDVRRWGIYEQTENEPIIGMDIQSNEPDYYSKTIVNHSRVRNRIVHKRMNLLPLSKNEIRKVIGLDQNPGWTD